MERTNRILVLLTAALAVVLTVAIASLIVGVLAIRHDVHTIGTRAADASVGSDAIQPGAVTRDKLAPDAVTSVAIAPNAVTQAKLAPSSVGASQLQPNAVTSRNVRFDALRGDDILESTLFGVRSADWAKRTGSTSSMSCPPGTRPVPGKSHVERSVDTAGDWTLVTTVVCAAP